MNKYEDIMDYLEMYIDISPKFHRILIKYHKRFKVFNSAGFSIYNGAHIRYMQQKAQIICNKILALRLAFQLDEEYDREMEVKEFLKRERRLEDKERAIRRAEEDAKRTTKFNTRLQNFVRDHKRHVPFTLKEKDEMDFSFITGCSIQCGLCDYCSKK